MLKDIKQFKRRFPYISVYNLFVLFLLAISVIGYVIFLKSSKHEKVYIQASIQRPDWWQSTSQIPSELLTRIKAGDSDVSGKLKVEEIKYFISQEPNWSVNVNDKSVGRVKFEIDATNQNNRLYYDGQELLIGNPLAISIAETKLELLITDISYQKFTNEYSNKSLVVRVYDKYPEQLQEIRKGIEFKDNDGFVYARVLNVNTEHSRLTTYDQYGVAHQERNPWKYDAIIDIETLAREENSRLVGYDGRTIAIGKSFVFNSPFFDDVGGWIVGIK